MKKTYITPSVEIEMIAMESIIAASILIEGETDGSDGYDSKTEGDWNIWSDDEE